MPKLDNGVVAGAIAVPCSVFFSAVKNDVPSSTNEIDSMLVVQRVEES